MPPRPKTTTLAPASTLGGVDDGADAGGDAAADVANLVEGGVFADFGQRDLGHHRVVREGAAAHVVVNLRLADVTVAAQTHPMHGPCGQSDTLSSLTRRA
jgi:hypothetical protein